jgi:hypothetical protein
MNIKKILIIPGIFSLFLILFVLSSCRSYSGDVITDDDVAKEALSSFNYEIIDKEQKTIRLISYESYITDVEVPGVVGTYTVVELAENLFFNEGISSVTLPDTITNIGKGCFANCTFKEVVIPDSVITIGSQAFYGCDKLKTITLSNSLTELSEGILESCDSLTEIIIPDNVEKINDKAFYFCGSLTKVVLPKNLKQIRPKAFVRLDSNGNFDLYYKGSEEQYNNNVIADPDNMVNVIYNYE